MKELLNVTLYGLDGLGKETKENENIIDWSRKNFKFGNIVLATANRDVVKNGDVLEKNGITYIGVPNLNRQDYNHFDSIGINSFIKTDYCMGFHTDGFIINPDLWDDNFLKYDYIGAPWPITLPFMMDHVVHFRNESKKGRNGITNTVGNGGFCIRSKKFLNFCASEGYDWRSNGNWDVYFTVFLGNVAANKYGIKFAPEDVAAKFSIDDTFSGRYSLEKSFGFHGKQNLSLAKIIMSKN